MGVVYKAEDTRLRRPVALKFLPPQFHADGAALERFRREARAASALNHPNICTVYDIGESEGQPFIAMEYLEGKTLRERILAGPLKLEELLDAGTQIADALQAAHSRRIVHRDIKPANIFMTENGQVKVMDFGLAKVGRGPSADGEAATAAATLTQELVTSPGTAPGTVAYMSPEQARGENLDFRSDLFSFGAVLYEMATGYQPFRGNTSAVVFEAILNKAPVAPGQLRPDLPAELERIINSALEKDRNVRCQSASEIKAALMRLRRGNESSGATAAAARRASSRVALWTIAAMACIVLAGAAWLVWRWLRGPVTPFRQTKISRVTAEGKAKQAVAISNDGKYLAYVLGDAVGESVWVRQIATGSDLQLVAPMDVIHWRIAFSPDSSYVYFTRGGGFVGTLYRVPVIGGMAQKLVTDVDTGPTFSPDGKRMAFMRHSSTVDNLVIANSDGGGEKVLATREAMAAVGQPAWSPDGEKIVWSTRIAEGDSVHDILIVSPLTGGKDSILPTKKWYGTWAVQWLKDGNSLLLSARESAKATLQLWQVSWPGGQSRQITNDLSNYVGVSVTDDAKTLVAVETYGLSNLWLLENNRGSEARQITHGVNRADGINGIAWTSDGRIVYSSMVARESDLWITRPDGSEQRRLTHNGNGNAYPCMSPDGRWFTFQVGPPLGQHIWRMNLDGGDPKQLTFETEFQTSHAITPDGKWIYYANVVGQKSKLFRIPAVGGKPVAVYDGFVDGLRTSPKGDLLAFFNFDSEKIPNEAIAIMRVEGGPILKRLSLPYNVQWSRDGRALFYPKKSRNASAIWTQPVDGGPPRRVTGLQDGDIINFDLSPESKQFVIARGHEVGDVVMIMNVD